MNVGYTHFIQQSPQLKVGVHNTPDVVFLLNIVVVELLKGVVKLFRGRVCEFTDLVAVYGWLYWALRSRTFQGVGSGTFRHDVLSTAQWMLRGCAVSEGW